MAVKQSGMSWRDYQRRLRLSSNWSEAERSEQHSMYEDASGPYPVEIESTANQPALLSIAEAPMTSFKYGEGSESKLTSDIPSSDTLYSDMPYVDSILTRRMLTVGIWTAQQWTEVVPTAPIPTRPLRMGTLHTCIAQTGT